MNDLVKHIPHNGIFNGDDILSKRIHVPLEEAGMYIVESDILLSLCS